MLKISILALLAVTGYALMGHGTYATALRQDLTATLDSVSTAVKSGPVSLPEGVVAAGKRMERQLTGSSSPKP